MNWRVLPVAVLILGSAFVAAADTVRLKNGNLIEGIVSTQNATHVCLDLGVGSTTISRAAIQAIELADEHGNQAIRDGWKKKYYLHKKYIPSGLEALASSFTALNGERNAALQARQHLADIRDKETRLRTELETLRSQHVAISRRLAATDPKSNVEAYNAVVTESNALGAKLAVTADALEEQRKTRQPALETIAHYMDRLAAFQQALSDRLEEARNVPPDADSLYVLNQLAASLKAREGEMLTSVVETQPLQGGAALSVTVNGNTQGRFILDTGASMMTFSDEFARRLRLDLSKAQEVECVMADGRRVKAKCVVLDSVSLGNAHASNVEAAILPPPGDSLDGLLGMSFLRNFVVHFDGATGKLILKQFVP